MNEQTDGRQNAVSDSHMSMCSSPLDLSWLISQRSILIIGSSEIRACASRCCRDTMYSIDLFGYEAQTTSFGR